MSMMFSDARLVCPLDPMPPDAPAVDDGSRILMRGQVWQQALGIAQALRQRGIQPGDNIALLMENRSEFWEAILGAMLAGAWLTPVNWHLASAEIEYVLKDSQAKLVMASGQFRAQPKVPVLCADDDWPQPAYNGWPLPEEPAGGLMLYTSGTTGRPKGVRRASPATLGEWLQAGRQFGKTLGLEGAGPHLVTGPLYHAAPLLFALYDFLNGAEILIMPRFDARRALALMQSRRVVCTHWVPTMFVRALQLPASERPAAFPALRCALHGAAPIAPAIKRQMIEWWGPVLVEYWGGSESGTCTRVDTAEWLRVPGTVGRALSNYEIWAEDEQGQRLPPGETGLLMIRHRQLDEPFRYWRDPVKTAATLVAPGVFSLGDIGHVDEQGYVFLSDRASNMIISGGVNIYPAEIEQVFISHPGVVDVAVFGIPHEEWGEEVKVLVQWAEDIVDTSQLSDALLCYAREKLAKYKLPKQIDFVTELPRTDSGKIYVRALRAAYWQGHERMI